MAEFVPTEYVTEYPDVGFVSVEIEAKGDVAKAAKISPAEVEYAELIPDGTNDTPEEFSVLSVEPEIIPLVFDRDVPIFLLDDTE
jgi:hypothetical protein